MHNLLEITQINVSSLNTLTVKRSTDESPGRQCMVNQWMDHKQVFWLYVQTSFIRLYILKPYFRLIFKNNRLDEMTSEGFVQFRKPRILCLHFIQTLQEKNQHFSLTAPENYQTQKSEPLNAGENLL